VLQAREEQGVEVIYEFTYEHGFLSNFHPVTVEMGGLPYPSVEHAYQAAKTLDEADRDMIRLARTPGIAKSRGRLVRLRPGWDQLKDGIMRDLLEQKFSREPLTGLLLATGDAVIIEGNAWGDRYWGVSGGSGLNKLGLALMAIRQGLADAAA
jgi:ribA/ribD-fused uncharacterized protein